MSRRRQDGAVIGLVLLMLVVAFAVLASLDMPEDRVEQRPTPAVPALEASPPVVVDAAAPLDVRPIVAVAIPPKTATTPIPVLVAPPEPEPELVVEAAERREPATSTPAAPDAPASTSTSAPAPAPAAPPTLTVHDRAADYAAAYGCGGIALDPNPGAGNRGFYGWDGVIRYDPNDPQLGYVIGHECMHARQEWAYGGDVDTMAVDLTDVGGFEYIADCMSQAVGAGSGGYTSSCGGARGEAARTILAGGRYGGGQ